MDEPTVSFYQQYLHQYKAECVIKAMQIYLA